MPLGNPIQKNNDSRIVSATATAGQTQFTISGGYIVNNISVFRNGVRLSNADDFTASDGSTVNLNTAADVGDTLDFHVWSRFTVSDAIIGAASTQAINGNLNVAGSLYADVFRPSEVITEGNVNMATLSVSGISTLGIATVSAIGLDLTGTANISGVSTFKDDVVFTGAAANVTWDKSTDDLIFNDNAKAIFGTGNDLSLYHDGTTNIIDSASANLEIRHGAEKLAAFAQDGQAELWFDNSKKLETHNTGVKVTGIATISSDAFVGSAITMYASSGIVSATAFYGDGSQLEGVSASGSSLDITSCLFI